MHGIFDSHALAVALVNRLRERRGLEPLDPAAWQDHREMLAGRYENLAKFLREHVDLSPVYAAIGGGG